MLAHLFCFDELHVDEKHPVVLKSEFTARELSIDTLKCYETMHVHDICERGNCLLF